MTYFLQDVARYLYQRNSGNFRHTVIVFPSRRARLFFNYFLSQISDKPLWAPNYYTISDFIQKLSGLQLADQLTLLFRLYKVFKKVTSSPETFDNFFYYCEVILADFDDIDKYRINPDALYANLSDLKAIEDYKDYLEDFQLEAIRNFWDIMINSQDSDEKREFLSIWDVLGTIYTEFSISLEEEGLAYEGKAYRRAVDKINSGEELKLFENELVFIGFNALNRCEELLFDKFKSRGNAVFFWDYDESYIGKDFHEAGYFLSRYIRRYPQPADFITGNHTTAEEQKITTISVPSAVAQAKIIDTCLELSNSSTIGSPLKTALILADESLLLPVVNSLPQQVEEVNISMGYPIIDTPAYSLISALTDLHKNKQKNKKGEFLYYHKDFFSVLNHAFLHTIFDEESLKKLQDECKRKNLVYINTRKLTLDNIVLDIIFRPLESPVEFGHYLRKIIETIADRLKENETTDKTKKWQLEILFTIHKALMRFEALIDEEGIELSFSTTLRLLRSILKRISVPFSGEPLTGLQVMGILETRTLDFENLIILSMNEGKFPKTEHIPSLIPFTLREAFGLPIIKHQDAIFGYYFYRLLHRSRNVVLVYNSKSEGLQKGEPSRYIYQLRYEWPEPPSHLDIGYEIGPQMKKKIRIDKSEKVYSVLKKYEYPDCEAFISPSALNTYLDCSLKFYFRYIEEISEPGIIQEQIEADIFGKILHKAMSVLYKPFYDKECKTNDFETIRKNKDLVNKAIQQAFAEEYFMKPEIKNTDFRGVNLIIRRVIEQYVDGILAYDARSAPLTIMSTERKYYTKIQPAGASTELCLGGFIDRIDIKEGIVRVVDYKTGKRYSDYKSIESLFTAEDNKRNRAVFQTFLYSWIISKEKSFNTVQPVLYYVRDIFQNDYSPEVYQSENRNRIVVRNFLDYEKEFEDRLIKLVNEIYDPSLPFKQTDDIEQCKHCPYNEICLREND